MSLDNVSKLCRYAQKNGLTERWDVDSTGPDHNKRFSMRAVIDGKAYPWGKRRRTKKEAKQDAARTALNVIDHSIGDENRNSVDVTPADSMDAEDGGSPEESSQESEETSQANSSVNKSDSIVFKDISNLPKTQGARPAARSTRKTRQKPEDRKKGQNAKPQAAKQHPVEQQDAVKCKRKHRGPRATSRFTEEFDSISFLGSGGFGVVYEARHKNDNQLYAVKIAQSNKDSLREVKALAKLHHAHIVSYYHCWEEDAGHTWHEHVGKLLPKGSSSCRSVDYSTAKFLYIKMEVCTKTLSKWIEEKNGGTLTDFQRAQECLPIFLQIVEGVKYIHLKKQIHRDLKPSNILFGKDGLMKIADFGLVTKNDGSQRTCKRGTKTYMAPEQENGNYDHKVDMFPLGLIFLEMIYKMSSDHEKAKVLEEARNQKLPENCPLFKEFRLIRRLLSLDPKDRPEASEVGAEVEGWIQRELQGNVTV